MTVPGRKAAATHRRLADAYELSEGPTAPDRTGRPKIDAKRDTSLFTLTLIEGRKRQIRRACETLGHPVLRLVRIRMGPLRLGRLAAGAARPLGAEERRALLRLRDERA